MDTEELIKKCKAISLNGETRGKITLKSRMKEKGEKIMAGCLVGKVLLNREVKKEGFKAALLPVWKTMKEIKIEELGDNIFIFQFGCEADKRKVLAGGPWHFDKALIVMTEPAGLGEVTKQNFTHVSFWVQILNVPIMCMNTEMLRELGESIGRVEEVATDVTGACFGKYARLRISIDITKPLIKVLHLRQEDEEAMDREEQEEGEDSVNSEKEIPMPVRYERLPDFCYVCGHVGHQYRECANYKNQLREEMVFGPWMKAPSMIEQLKQNRGKEKGRTESEKKSQNYQTTVVQDKQGNPEPQLGKTKSSEKTGSGQDPSTSVEIPRMSDQSRDKQPGTAEGTFTRGRSQKEAGNENLKERENESEIEKKKSEMEGKKVIVFSPKKGGPTDKSPNAEGAEGLEVNKKKSKRCKWKLQARNVDHSIKHKSGQTATKRPRGEIFGDSPETKKQKMGSPTSEITLHSPNAECKLKLEMLCREGNDLEAMLTKDSTAEAGHQPRRQL